MLLFAYKHDDRDHFELLIEFPRGQSEAEISLNLGEFGFVRVQRRFSPFSQQFKIMVPIYFDSAHSN